MVPRSSHSCNQNTPVLTYADFVAYSRSFTLFYGTHLLCDRRDLLQDLLRKLITAAMHHLHLYVACLHWNSCVFQLVHSLVADIIAGCPLFAMIHVYKASFIYVMGPSYLSILVDRRFQCHSSPDTIIWLGGRVTDWLHCTGCILNIIVCNRRKRRYHEYS